MATTTAPIVLGDGIEERVRDGTTEHRHPERDYWHPADRAHNQCVRPPAPPDPTQTMWEIVDDDMVYDIIEAMRYASPNADRENDPAGVTEEMFSAEWCAAVSSVLALDVGILYHAGEVYRCKISSRYGDVSFYPGQRSVEFEKDTRVHKAKGIIESGAAKRYVAYPNMVEAMHILHVLTREGYYDLIELPQGGHIPPAVLSAEYGVTWDIIATVPRGKPRDMGTFACPICGGRSYFTGPCNHCRGGDLRQGEGDIPANEAELQEKYIRYAKYVRDERKKLEHGMINEIIESGDWSGCLYIRG